MICYKTSITVRTEDFGGRKRIERYDADRIEGLTDAICDELLLHGFEGYDGHANFFALGFAAALDVLAGGVIGKDCDIVKVVQDAWNDTDRGLQFGEVTDFFSQYFKRRAFGLINEAAGEPIAV